MKSIKLLGIFIILTGSVSFSQAFSNGNITCTLSNGTVVNFNVTNCYASISKWVDGGIINGVSGIRFSMSPGRGILNRCTSNYHLTLHLDSINGRVYNGSDSSKANCEDW
jgi:hypothetical protein